MAADTYLTLSGNLTAAPKSGESRSGATWARIRVASTSRLFDRAENQWRDGTTVFMDVVCWRRLAENVVLTLERGDRVLVSGRLHQRSYDDQQGVRHTTMELEADSIGPDLSKAAARLMRPLAVVDDAVTADAPDTSADIDAREPEAAPA